MPNNPDIPDTGRIRRDFQEGERDARFVRGYEQILKRKGDTHGRIDRHPDAGQDHRNQDPGVDKLPTDPLDPDLS